MIGDKREQTNRALGNIVLGFVIGVAGNSLTNQLPSAVQRLVAAIAVFIALIAAVTYLVRILRLADRVVRLAARAPSVMGFVLGLVQKVGVPIGGTTVTLAQPIAFAAIAYYLAMVTTHNTAVEVVAALIFFVSRFVGPTPNGPRERSA